MKITFIGAGSTVFAKNVIGDIMMCPSLWDAEVALYDIDAGRLEDSRMVLSFLNETMNAGRATIRTYLGTENRREALRDSSFVINAIQVGGYKPCTVIDFEIPKKYGLRQTIGDTLGIGGIFRALRTIPVMEGIAQDMEEVCPRAWLLNYTNPMAMITGYLQRYTKVNTIGLCHSVQVCTKRLLEALDMADYVGKTRETIAGINHMAWLLELTDSQGNDLYPEIRRRAKLKNAGEKHGDMVRYDYIDKLGYYCTESSEHNAEYNPFYLKQGRDDLIEKFNIPLDEYPRRCIEHESRWAERKEQILREQTLEHTRTREYASWIMDAMVTNTPYKLGGNVINNGLIPNLPAEACVEVPCMVDNAGIHPTYIGALPLQLAAMNASNIYPQLLTIEAAHTKNVEALYHAAMMDPVTGAQLSTDDIIAMCNDLMEAHKAAGFPVL